MLLFPFLAFILIFFTAINILPIRRIWKLLLIIPVAAACFKFHILYLLGGKSFFSPDLSPATLLISSWIFISAILFSFFMLLTGFVRFVWRLISYLRKQKPGPLYYRNWNRINAAILVLTFVLATVGMYHATRIPEVKEYTVPLPKCTLPAGKKELRIAFLTDLHADHLTRADRIRAIVDRTNAAKPDVILLGGDFADGTPDMVGDGLLPLKDLKAPFGVYGVPGNHEYYSGYDLWIHFLERELNVDMLENESVIIPGGIGIAGVTDPRAHDDNIHADPEKALSALPPDHLRILLSHQPKTAGKNAECGADLQLSGHTHGGMFYGMDLLVALFNSGFVSGWYQVGNMKLFVSNGASLWNGFPVRLGHDSEIPLIRIVPGK